MSDRKSPLADAIELAQDALGAAQGDALTRAQLRIMLWNLTGMQALITAISMKKKTRQGGR